MYISGQGYISLADTAIWYWLLILSRLAKIKASIILSRPFTLVVCRCFPESFSFLYVVFNGLLNNSFNVPLSDLFKRLNESCLTGQFMQMVFENKESFVLQFALWLSRTYYNGGCILFFQLHAPRLRPGRALQLSGAPEGAGQRGGELSY